MAIAWLLLRLTMFVLAALGAKERRSRALGVLVDGLTLEGAC